MNTQCFSTPDSLSSSNSEVSFSSNSAVGENHEPARVRTRPARPPATFLIRMAMKISRARWFTFLRRVFHYQNGSRSNLGSNPFNSSTWIMLEFAALLVQISIITFALAVSKKEEPLWPMRLWIAGYDFGCLLSLLLLYGRCRQVHVDQGDAFGLSDLEQQRGIEYSRCTHLMDKCRTSLELFFAIWFVMGNVWMFDSRFGSFNRAPKLHALCVSLLVWNGLSYLFPFLLFLLLCCCLPILSSVLGYNMQMGCAERGASDDQISNIPSWKYKAVDTNPEVANGVGRDPTAGNYDPECCICLAKYKDKEEIRKLPCSHIFHLNCVDQWLRIMSCCPLCKQELER